MSSILQWDPLDVAGEPGDAAAALPTATNMAAAENNEEVDFDFDNSFEEDFNAAWEEAMQAQQAQLDHLAASSDDDHNSAQEEMEENLPSDLELRINRLQAELDLANAVNLTARNAREQADAIAAKQKSEREEEITSLKEKNRELMEQLESSLSEKDRVQNDKEATSRGIDQLKMELQGEKRLRGDAEQTANAVALQLSTVDQLLEQRTKDAACLRENLQRLTEENSSAVLMLATEQQAWAQERQNLVGQIESLGATIAELVADQAAKGPDDALADQMRRLRLDTSGPETTPEQSTQLDDLRKEIATARAEGFEAGSQETRQQAEVRHQDIVADYLKQLKDANARAERAEQAAIKSVSRLEEELVRVQAINSQASAHLSLVEKEHAEQIARYQSRLDDADNLAARANSGKLEAVQNASLREEKHSKLEARFKLAQAGLEQAKKREALEMDAKEFSRLKDRQIALLKLDLEKAQSTLRDSNAKSEACLAVEQSTNEDNKRQIAVLKARLEREMERGLEREKKAKGVLDKLKEGQKRQIATLNAKLANERSRNVSVRARQKLPCSADSGLSIFFVVAFVSLVVLGLDLLANPATSDMHPCGVSGYLFALCNN